MKKLLMILSMVLLMGAGGFIEGLEDLPLPKNWHQVQNDIVAFGNEESNFVQIYLQSKKESYDKVVAFYKKVLPQLGWQFKSSENNSYKFVRENETLLIEKVDDLARITSKSSN